MDRAIPTGNKLINQRIQQLRNKKHRQTLSEIKTKGSSQFQTTMYQQQTPKLLRYSTGYIQNKVLEIQKQNIKIFNKIASILKDKPRSVGKGGSTHLHGLSFQEANTKHKKQQMRIKTQNQILEKRIFEQKPTIKNKQFFKDRLKNVRYLKIMGKFPYEKKKTNISSSSQSSHLHSLRSHTEQSEPHQIYQARSNEFLVKITKMSNKIFCFSVQISGLKKVLTMQMQKQQFEDQLMKCGYDYDTMIGQLRLSEKQEITFQRVNGGELQEQENQEQKEESQEKSQKIEKKGSTKSINNSRHKQIDQNIFDKKQQQNQ